MEKTETRRQRILNQIADHLLATGLKDASLRHLAAAIGTSDRMLLWAFAWIVAAALLVAPASADTAP